MIILKKVHDPESVYDLTDIEFTIDDTGIDLVKILEEVKSFLIGCGYVIDTKATIEIVEND